MKGALEGVLSRCRLYRQHGQPVPLEGSTVPADMVRHAAELG